MVSLDFDIIIQSWPLLQKGLFVTLQITLIAIISGMILGTLLAVARISPFAPLRWLAVCYVTCFRSVPLVMVLLWFSLLVPQFIAWLFNLPRETNINLVAAMVAFSLFEAAYYCEIIRAGIKSISMGQTQAAYALGMTRLQTLRLVILPQAFRVMTPLLLTQGIILFQDTSLVYMLQLGDFFRTATNIGKIRGYETGMILFAGSVYFIICFTVSRLVDFMKRKNSMKRSVK